MNVSASFATRSRSLAIECWLAFLINASMWGLILASNSAVRQMTRYETPQRGEFGETTLPMMELYVSWAFGNTFFFCIALYGDRYVVFMKKWRPRENNEEMAPVPRRLLKYFRTVVPCYRLSCPHVSHGCSSPPFTRHYHQPI